MSTVLHSIEKDYYMQIFKKISITIALVVSVGYVVCSKSIFTEKDFPLEATLEADGRVRKMILSKKYLFSGSGDGTIEVWDLTKLSSDSKPVVTLNGHNRWISSLISSDDGKYLFSGFEDGIIDVWDLTIKLSSDSKPVATLNRHDRWIRSLISSDDGKYLFSGSSGGTIDVCDLTIKLSSDSKPVATLTKHKGLIKSLILSKNGKYLFSGFEDGTIEVWALNKLSPNSTPIATLKGYDHFISFLILSDDGKYLFLGFSDGTIDVWDLTIKLSSDSKPVATLTKHKGWFRSLILSKNGKYLFSGFEDGTIKVWDITKLSPNSTPVATLTGHNDEIYSLILSKNEKYLFSGLGDGTIKVWDLTKLSPNSTPVATLTGHKNCITSLILSEDGKYLFFPGKDGTIIVRELPQEMWVKEEPYFTNKKHLIPGKKTKKPKLFDINIFFGGEQNNIEKSCSIQKICHLFNDISLENNDLFLAMNTMLENETHLKKLAHLEGTLLLTSKNGNKPQFDSLIRETANFFSFAASLIKLYPNSKNDIIDNLKNNCLETVKHALMRINAIYKNWGEKNLLKQQDDVQKEIQEATDKLLRDYKTFKIALGEDTQKKDTLVLNDLMQQIQKEYKAFLENQKDVSSKNTFVMKYSCEDQDENKNNLNTSLPEESDTTHRKLSQ